MNEMAPEQQPDSGVVLSFETRPDENATDPERFQDIDIIDAFLAEATHMSSARDKKDVAGIVSGLLTPRHDEKETNSLRVRWQKETHKRIAKAEESVTDDELYQDPVVLEITKRLKVTSASAKTFEEERRALRQLIDVRTIALAGPDMITEDREDRWMELIDKLHHL
jgi:hypothetical protein